MTTFEDKFLKQIHNTQSYNKLFSIPLKLFKKCVPEETVTTPVKILILNSVCNGFGDVIFAHKLKTYLQEWYGELVEVKIASNSIDKFIALNENLDDLIHLDVRAKNPECKRFSIMNACNAAEFINENRLVSENIEDFHLYLIAPITRGSKPNHKEIHRLVKASNQFNTFFISEYNYPIHKSVLFNTGIGKGRMGLMMSDNTVDYEKLSMLRHHPYSIMYVSDNDNHLQNCYDGFLELVTSKYEIPRLDIVAPDWMREEMSVRLEQIRSSINPYYSKIVFFYKDGKSTMKQTIMNDHKHDTQVVFRFDIEILSLDDTRSLYQHSLPHVLLTGDQSITDFLSVRREPSMPFYQALTWKRSFYTSLAKALPNKFLKSYKTSCGNIDAIKYQPKFDKFMKNNDFRVKAKPIMDAVLCSVGYTSEEYENIKYDILHSTKKSTLNKKLDKYYDE
jgi:hypothetical protein